MMQNNTTESSWYSPGWTVENLTINMSNSPVEPYHLSVTQEFISTIVLEKIYKLLLTMIGLFGNVMTVIILTKRKNRHSSTSIYLTALAVSDILIIVFGPFFDWIEIMFNVIRWEYGLATCKFQAFMYQASMCTSSWILVAVTLERAIGVRSPYKVRMLCTSRKAVVVVVSIWCLFYIINTHFLFGMGHVYNKMCEPVSRRNLKFSDEYLNFTHYVLPWIDFLITFGLPFVFICGGNAVIIRELAVNQSYRKTMTSTRPRKKSLSLSILLISVNIVFILSVGPIYIVSIMMPYLVKDAEQKIIVTVREFWGPLLNGLQETNAAFNFVLYFLNGTKFRKEVKALCWCSPAAERADGVFDLSVIVPRSIRDKDSMEQQME